MTDHNTFLIVLQSCSLTLTLTMFIILVLSRFHVVDKNPKYEKIRWLLATTMLVYSLHYILQMVFGFRAQGDDVGAVINILFYSPTVYALSYPIIYISCGKGYQRRHIQASITSLALIVCTFVGGYIYYGSLHMKYAIYIMGILFFMTIVYFVLYSSKELQRVRKLVDEESGQRPVLFNLYMSSATKMLFLTAFLVPVFIFNTPLLALLAPFFMIALIFYIISFIALGHNYNNVSILLKEEQGEEKNTYELASTSTEDTIDNNPLTEKQKQQINSLINQWNNQRGFSDASLNSSSLAIRLGISKSHLVQYLREVEGKTFRVWLSNLRIEEAKRLIIERPDFSNEAIAEACGITRIYLQNKFKEVTNVTPNEWREIHR